ncbi:MAG TPA: FAD-dependent monooxygenase [Acidiferrobacter sp.]|nr:FAD-dependent monooxygenase [Acidiferrobacter sp.]
MPVSRGSYDIVICGGGLVGTSLALSLAHLPLTVCLVDPAPTAPPRHKDDRTFTIAQGSKRTLTSLGVWPLLPSDSFHPISEIEVSDCMGRFGLTHIDAHELETEALGFVVENSALLGALYVALETTKVTVRTGHFTDIDQHTNSVTVTIAEADGPHQLSCRLLVGADGTNSAVRTTCAIPVTRHDYNREALVTNCRVSAPRPHTAFERFAEQGPIAALPLGDDRYTFVISRIDAKLWQDLSEADFLVQLQAAFGNRLGRLLDASARLRFPLILQQAPNPAAERVVIIGNAAHTLHPVAGQGFNLGLRDVAALADRIADAYRRHEDFGSRAHLDAYVKGRARDTANTIRFTDSLVRIFGYGAGPLVVARNVALTLVDCLPGIKRALGQRTMGLKGPLPRLMRGLKP